MNKYSERFPLVNNLVFTMWGNRNGASVQQQTFCRLTGFDMQRPYYDFQDLLQDFHSNAAEERHYIFRDAAGNPVDDMEQAETMDMFTGKLSVDRGLEVWLRCRKNREPKSKFLTVAAYEKHPEAEKLHPLVQKYPTIFDFVFCGRPPLQQKFKYDGLALPSEEAVYDLLYNTWENLTDDMLTCTRYNEPCTLDEADTVCIRLQTSSVYAQLRCTPNTNQPPMWYGQVHVSQTQRKYAPTSQFPNLMGFRGALINVREDTLERIRLEIHKLVDNQDAYHLYQADMQENYRVASDDAFVFCDRHHIPCARENAEYLHYHTGLYNKANQAEILLIVRRNPGYPSVYEQPWTAEPVGYMQGFTIADTSDLYPGIPAKNYIFAWADFEQIRGRTFTDMIADLKRAAMEETWDFRDDRSNSILANYIQYTVARLLRIEDIKAHATGRARNAISARMGKPVVYDAKKTVAVLNTGLYTKQYKQLVLVFSRSDTRSKWIYRSVEQLGSYRLRELKIDERPSAPVYWDDAKELLYPFDYNKSATEQRPEINMDHIMNRIERLPALFVKRAISSALYGDEQADVLCAMVDRGDYHILKQECRKYPEIAEEMELLIKAEMERALECQNLNFRYIVPTFYPTMEKLCFLMPLRLCSRQTPDTALVISVDGERKYGRTIMTMDMAYRDSRLLCKPEAEWLNPKDILNTDKESVAAEAVVAPPAAPPAAAAVPSAPAVPKSPVVQPAGTVTEFVVPEANPAEALFAELLEDQTEGTAEDAGIF